MMLITNENLFNELQQIKKMLHTLIDRDCEHSIEEISLSKVCKLLHRGDATIKQLVKSEQLKAITYRDNKNNLRYRFKISDVHAFQKSVTYNQDQERIGFTESSEEIANRIFHTKKTK